jgi:hypothetical protein
MMSLTLVYLLKITDRNDRINLIDRGVKNV